MIVIPTMNPIKTYDSSGLPDYQDTFPLVDNITQRTEYIKGLLPVKWYKEHLINKVVRLQYRISGLTDETMTVLKPDGTTDSITPTDITPAAWVGDPTNKYEYTPTVEGLYYIYFTEEPTVRTDTFQVVNDIKHRKLLVEIQYQRSENDFDMIFKDNAIEKFVGLAYFTGKLIPKPTNKKSVFTTDRGILSTQKSTPVMGYELILSDIHYTYDHVINMIFSCDFLQINGKTFQPDGGIDIDRKADSDVGDLKFDLSQREDNYSINIT